MDPLLSYDLNDGVATITMDDGKVNALSPAMLDQLSAALERAGRDAAPVVLTGREQTFSAGFDLRCPPERWQKMVTGGARLAELLLSFPRPVIAACNGNAIAMAGFVLLSCDHRVGVTGEHKIGLNEVAIGLTVPWFGIEVARHRLSRPYFDRCVIPGTLLGPDEALSAGFLERLVGPDELEAASGEAAEELAGINADAHAATKLRIRAQALAGVRDGIRRITDEASQDW